MQLLPRQPSLIAPLGPAAGVGGRGVGGRVVGVGPTLDLAERRVLVLKQGGGSLLVGLRQLGLCRRWSAARTGELHPLQDGCDE